MFVGRNGSGPLGLVKDPLEVDPAVHGVEGAFELDEVRVPDRLDDPARVPVEDRFGAVSVLLEQARRETFVLLGERHVADHVGQQEWREPAGAAVPVRQTRGPTYLSEVNRRRRGWGFRRRPSTAPGDRWRHRERRPSTVRAPLVIDRRRAGTPRPERVVS